MSRIQHVPRSIALLGIARPQDWASLVLAFITEVREAATTFSRTGAALTTRAELNHSIHGVCAMEIALDTVTLKVADTTIVLWASFVRAVLAVPTLVALAKTHSSVAVTVAIALKLS
jgi:hypothetical protein